MIIVAARRLLDSNRYNTRHAITLMNTLFAFIFARKQSEPVSVNTVCGVSMRSQDHVIVNTVFPSAH